MKNVRVLWLSRHKPTDVQVTELQKKLGLGVEIVPVSTKVESGQEVLDLMGRYYCHDYVVAVLPIELIAEVCSLGVKPLRAVMKRRLLRDGVEFTFSHYEVVEKVVIETRPL